MNFKCNLELDIDAENEDHARERFFEEATYDRSVKYLDVIKEGKDILGYMYDEGLLDVAVFFPEGSWDHENNCPKEDSGDHELQVLHMISQLENESGGSFNLKGYVYDRQLSDANFELEHVYSVDLVSPSVIAWIAKTQLHGKGRKANA